LNELTCCFLINISAENTCNDDDDDAEHTAAGVGRISPRTCIWCLNADMLRRGLLEWGPRSTLQSGHHAAHTLAAQPRLGTIRRTVLGQRV
jgi:hypothetical protein